ncbi:MAG: DNA polymerase III subunit delta [Deltaproteobacteria bacterium]|jgi:DNA polymerase-3 subunit delta|nr:DNA polymerase III subunit delta [Deltaproteobacteria bacterium]
MELERFVKEIASPQRQPFYLLVGSNPDSLDIAIKAAKGVVSPGFFDFNYQSFKTEDADWGQILEDAGTGPFFQPPRILVVKREKYLVSELERLSQFLLKPNPDNTILLIAENPGDKLKFFKDILDKNEEVDCRAPQKNELPGWLMKKATQKNVSLTLDGAKAMIDRLGENLSQLLAELDKFSLYPGPNVKLTAKEIASLVSLGPTAIIYELAEPLANQTVAEMTEVLLDLEENAEPFPLLHSVASHFLKLIKFKLSLETANPESLGSPTPLGLKPYYFSKLKAQAEIWSWPRLTWAVETIQRAYRDMVTVSTDKAVILEELTINIATRLARP